MTTMRCDGAALADKELIDQRCRMCSSRNRESQEHFWLKCEALESERKEMWEEMGETEEDEKTRKRMTQKETVRWLLGVTGAEETEQEKRRDRAVNRFLTRANKKRRDNAQRGLRSYRAMRGQRRSEDEESATDMGEGTSGDEEQSEEEKEEA